MSNNPTPPDARTDLMLPTFTALGSVWLDEICSEAGPSQKDVIGGSVAFATLGARLFTPKVRLVLRAGHDFPEDVLNTFRQWNLGLIIHQENEKPSSRGLLKYGGPDGSKRTYQHLTPPLPTTWEYLPVADVFYLKAHHFFGIPQDVERQIHILHGIRTGANLKAKPIMVWEPQSKSMRPATLETHLETAKVVDVFSPNHEELAQFFPAAEASAAFDRARIEAQAQVFLDNGVGRIKDGCVVVRAAQHGCLVMSRRVEATWLRPYHYMDPAKVVDPTGAGNAFLGAFAVGLYETGEVVEAARFGTVAASFVVEQVGVPSVAGQGTEELWNGVEVRERLQAFRDRTRGL